jgi:hypothetical protein
MFNNLSFTINTDTNQTSLDDLIDPIVGVQIATFIASNGSKCSTVNSMQELIRQNYFVSDRVSSILIEQVLGIRNICANWMNLNATVSFDENGGMINNSVAPTNITELKDSVFFTCERYFSSYEPIYTTTNINDVRDKIDSIVDDAITWSKSDGSGTWEYYLQNITTNYDYNQINNQISN